MNNKCEITEVLAGDKLLTGRGEICEAFNEHFANAGKKVQASIGAHSDNITRPLPSVKDGFKFPIVTETQICNLVQKMTCKRSTGPDGVSNYLLKKLISVIKTPLCVIFNKSLQSGVFPDLMKLARVLPLFKSGDQSIPDNYRPISLLPVLSKVLEKIVYQRMVEYLDKNNVIFPRQFGFRKGYSTSDAVLNFVGNALKAFDDKMFVLAIFIDLKKAFDMVSHLALLSKLKNLGVTDTELSWFESYVKNRQQYVDIGGTPLLRKILMLVSHREVCLEFYCFRFT